MISTLAMHDRLSPAHLAQLAKSLAADLAGEAVFDRYHAALYATDASIYEIEPVGVVFPRRVEDVVATVQFAAAHGLAIVPRGGGTSLSGQSIGAGIVIDFSRHLRSIVELDPREQTARVQPGVVLDELNAAAARHGLQFGPDVATSSRANLGGMIGNNSAGSRSIVYGKVVDHVLSLDCVLADGSRTTFGPVTTDDFHARQSGTSLEASAYRTLARLASTERDEILARFPRLQRRVSGYNLDELVPEFRQLLPVPSMVHALRQREAARHPGELFNAARLLVGSEGTLACLTEALVHLVPLPAARGVLALHFATLADAVAAVACVLPLDPSAVELFDGLIVRMARESLEYRSYLDFVVGDPESLLLVEISGDTAAEVAARIDRAQAELAGQPGLQSTVVALEPAQVAHVWACRKAALPLMMGVPGMRKPIAFVEDTAVALEHLPEFVRRFREILRANGTEGTYYGHASVGCLHIRPLLDTRDRADVERLARISSEVCDLVREFGGAMSGEHGDGLSRSYLNERMFGPRIYQAFRELKSAFDPQGIFNPGKVVEGPSPIEHLRHLPGEQTLPVLTVFDFAEQGGFAGAAAQCSGVGVCRKTLSGTMCPSFMATRDEEHSTRGRANALRRALSGKLATEELCSRELYDTFDLCLQCKGCKAECPSNVDVAKLKAEFLHHYWQRHGAPLGTRLLAQVALLNRWGSRTAPVSNWLAHLPGARWLGQWMAGIDRRRSLPRFSRQHFQGWFAQHAAPRHAATRGDVVLLDDCLTSYCEPQVNAAAVRVLEVAGYRVHLAGLPCCGRAMISKGLLDDARRLAEANVARLLPWALQGVPIVGCEPSCVLTLSDDYRDLLRGTDAQTVAGAARLIDQLLADVPPVQEPQPAAETVLLHGHCHQKALVGVGPTSQWLERTTGSKVQVVDSGCCGMAGSFGYEHYELSMQIGDRVLFPAVQTHDGPIVAPGFSCRHQIHDGTGKRAVHPVEYIAARLPQV
ncbi:MAG: FAD-binding protein [Pirellulales bacterium]|nr:FAD-binding protein [Pirellulales bacterium]